MSRALAIAVLLVGCDKPPNPPPVDAGTDVANCATDPRVSSYAPGMSVTSTSGALKFSLESCDPAPPGRTTNSWVLKVTDVSGNPVSGLSIDATPFMPDHGHGSPLTPTVTEQSGGEYNVTSLYFFMAGVWRTTFVTSPADGGAADSAEFFFCIDG